MRDWMLMVECLKASSQFGTAIHEIQSIETVFCKFRIDTVVSDNKHLTITFYDYESVTITKEICAYNWIAPISRTAESLDIVNVVEDSDKIKRFYRDAVGFDEGDVCHFVINDEEYVIEVISKNPPDTYYTQFTN